MVPHVPPSPSSLVRASCAYLSSPFPSLFRLPFFIVSVNVFCSQIFRIAEVARKEFLSTVLFPPALLGPWRELSFFIDALGLPGWLKKKISLVMLSTTQHANYPPVWTNAPGVDALFAVPTCTTGSLARTPFPLMHLAELGG
jgi:hypothetical protein